jgi:microcystin-dependent protein
MATVTGFTAERMLNIENSTVVDGEVQGDNLILQTRDGTPIDAGNVRGPKGDTGAIGQPVSPGIISMYGGNSAPAGYLLCDGRLVSRVTYAALFAEIGVIWGAGDGLNTFGLPDLQQRFPAGKGAAAWANALAGSGGNKDAALIQHQHDIGHTHNTANHAHGFDHGHTGSSDPANNNHTHTVPNHMHPGTGNTGGSAYGFRDITAAGQGDGWDIANTTPATNVRIWWEMTPATSWAGAIETGYMSANHAHGIYVSTATGTRTTDAGAQALTHTGSTAPLAGSVPVTDKNLPPYVIVNFIIKT